MKIKILLLQGHPDPVASHFGDALASAYATAASDAGHKVRTIRIAELSFPLLRSKAEWQSAEPPAGLCEAQEALSWAQHIVLFFPLWLGDMPAYTKGFLEQMLRPGFALSEPGRDGHMIKLLKGRSARIVVTMGMPALVYRWYFRAHSVKALERNILGFVGIEPIRESLVGMVESMSDKSRAKWLRKLGTLGRNGE